MHCKLIAVKVLHTLIWAVLASCVMAIPWAAMRGRFTLATVLIGVVFAEVLVLAFNRMRCPLTDLAARYTSERSDNFDIYLPRWLARHNQALFGGLYAAGVLCTALCWWLTGASCS